MTDQEAFERVVRHLLNQGRRSLSTRGMCSYRGATGLRCAVGCLIPDSAYRLSFESHHVSEIAERVPVLKGLRMSLLTDLQFTHDAYDPTSWVGRLAEVAARHGLAMPALESP